MEKRVRKYVLKPATEEEVKRLMEDQELMRKNEELEMLWNILMSDRSKVTEARYALWLDLAERLDF